MRRRAAFTLIEMVTVLVIIGTLTSMALPRFGRSLELRRADSAARQMSADILRAREYARVSGVSRTIVYGKVTNTYSIDLPDPDHPGSTYTLNLMVLYGATITDVDFKAGAVLSFNSEGAPSTGGTITVAVGRITRTIVVNSVTGTPTVGVPVQTDSIAPAQIGVGVTQ